ncbi:hypothetical protein [Mesorhizobium sp. WSM1497]|uniref:hypothetical protein n=1 Tax=Mesorhizobium sp. WSM1497 TaxID=278153 RepID=UPI000A602E2F|nr:hypothetical protein [Mesorhizobium sp. WSM1497]
MVISFRDFLRSLKRPSGGKIGYVFYHLSEDDLEAQQTILLLMEAKPYVDLGKGRRIMYHTAHIPDGQDHLHFVVNGKKIAAVNRDGTAHDRSHGIQLQKWALKGAKANYPYMKMPPDGLIENLYAVSDRRLLTEAVDDHRVAPRALQIVAELKATEKDAEQLQQ